MGGESEATGRAGFRGQVIGLHEKELPDLPRASPYESPPNRAPTGAQSTRESFHYPIDKVFPFVRFPARRQPVAVFAGHLFDRSVGL